MHQLLEKEGYDIDKAGLSEHPVLWGDMDSYQHVNNVVYLKWFEAARMNRFARYVKEFPESGFQEFFAAEKVGPIMRSVDLSWKYPITFPDKVTVLHKLLPITEPDRFTLQGVVVSHKAQKVAARITESIVTVDYANGGIKAPIPHNIKEILEGDT